MNKNQKNDMLCTGYARDHNVSNKHVPDDVINLCLKFYQDLKEKFEHYNPAIYKLSNNDTRVEKMNHSDCSTVYGSLGIISSSPSIHQWTFKMTIPHRSCTGIGLGIDETKHIRKDKGYFDYYHGKSKLYGIWSDGELVEWNCDDYMLKRDDFNLRRGDIVMMELDLYSNPKTLSYKVNDNEKQIIFNNVSIGEDIKYCMAVCMWSTGSYQPEVELLSYSSKAWN